MSKKRFIKVIINGDNEVATRIRASVAECVAMFSCMAHKVSVELSESSGKSRKTCAEFLVKICDINALNPNPEETAKLLIETFTKEGETKDE